jgi:zinc-finger of transposase IS204/IS1001/IS1096/IS1165/DDE superfamily endonuclease
LPDTLAFFTRFPQQRRREEDAYAAMETSQFISLGEGLELRRLEMSKGQLVLHVTATSCNSACPLCAQPATRLHSRYSRVVKDLPCADQQVRLMLHVRKFFCDTIDCSRKIFAERLPQLVAPWAHMTTRLCQAIQAIGLATCGRLGARLSSRLGMTTSWMTIVRAHEIKDFLKRGTAKRLHLEQLPGYAPDLNPDEGIWNDLKRVELGNVCCTDLDDLSAQLIRAKERLRLKRAIIRSCSRQCGYSV